MMPSGPGPEGMFPMGPGGPGMGPMDMMPGGPDMSMDDGPGGGGYSPDMDMMNEGEGFGADDCYGTDLQGNSCLCPPPADYSAPIGCNCTLCNGENTIVVYKP